MLRKKGLALVDGDLLGLEDPGAQIFLDLDSLLSISLAVVIL